MRKRILNADAVPAQENWLALERLATVEMTSEDPSYPIEAALGSNGHSEWRAATPGQQTIRLLFDRPQPLRRICLEFEGHGSQRTQEYVLRWSGEGVQSFHEIVRQQWNFTPQGATSEREDHLVDLPAVSLLELVITPDISGGSVCASLVRMRLA